MLSLLIKLRVLSLIFYAKIKTMIDTVIFDMDGTLLNTLEDLTQSVNYVLHSFKFPIYSSEQVKYFVGNGVEKLFQRALPETCDKKLLDDAVKLFKSYYAQNMYKNTAPYSGIIDVLKTLKNHSIKTAVVSNKFDSAVKELTNKYFSDLIDISVGQSDTIPIKPSPKGVLKCIEYLNAKNPIYVGDSDVDIQTAKNANIPAIGVTWGFRNEICLNGANHIAQKPSDLTEIIID